MLIGMAGMVGDSGASEHNLTGNDCTAIKLENLVALKTAAGTIHVTEGASTKRPIFGNLTGLSIKDAPNLLSIGRMVEQGYKFHWDKLEFPHLVDQHGRIIAFKNENYVLSSR